MFIRVKKVKKGSGKIYEYAHLVSGAWRKKRVKYNERKREVKNYNNSIHKYKKLLGRVYRFQDIKIKKEVQDLETFVYELSIEEVYKKLIENELLSRGFKIDRGIYRNGDVFVDLNRLIVHNGQKDVVLKLQDFGGYFCSLTLEDLFNIKKIENKYEGVYLLKKLKSLGVNLEHEQFFLLADRLLRVKRVN